MDKFDKKFGNYARILSGKNPKVYALDKEYPSMYKVFLIPDDYTPQEFIAFTLREFFHNSFEAIEEIINKLDGKEQILAGIYTKEIAETKIIQATEYALSNGYPLKCIMRKGKQNVIEES